MPRHIRRTKHRESFLHFHADCFARNQMLVRGVDLVKGPTGSEPGWIVVIDLPLDLEAAPLIRAMGLPVRHTVTKAQFEANVAMHATPSSEPMTVARVPILLSLLHLITPPPPVAEQYTVEATAYNPGVYCGEEKGVLSMSDALGLFEVGVLLCDVHLLNDFSRGRRSI